MIINIINELYLELYVNDSGHKSKGVFNVISFCLCLDNWSEETDTVTGLCCSIGIVTMHQKKLIEYEPSSFSTSQPGEDFTTCNLTPEVPYDDALSLQCALFLIHIIF